MKVWITGAGGSLGAELCRAFKEADWEVVATERADIDITNEGAVMDFAQANKPDVIVNAAAYNAVDVAEDEGRELAFAINGKVPGFLASAAVRVHAAFVHVSTDYVFSGDKRIYTETDSPDPISAYGESKAYGEMRVQEVRDASVAAPNMYIVRTSKLFGPRGTSASAKRSFVDVMLEKAQTGDALTLVDEEFGCPTYTPHLAEKILEMIVQNATPGIYHLVNEGSGVTWYGFGKEIFSVAGLHPQVTPISGDAFPRKAKRPQAVILQNTKISKLPERIDALKEYIKKRGQ